MLAAALAFSGCVDGGKAATAGLGEDVKAGLSALNGKRILFGHQSVGQDILDGLEELSRNSGTPVRVALPGDGGDSLSGILHIRVGKNRDPGSKCRDMLRALENAGGKYDAVVMKLCYVDVSAGTDVGALFSEYRDFVGKLRASHPGLLYVHCTLPLKSDPLSIKAKVKRALGMDPGNDADNVKRNEFNRMLLEHFKEDPVFDIAGAESTLPDGSRTTFRHGGKEYFRMAEAYTYDQGHLNAEGKARVAAEFAKTLSAALSARRTAAGGP